MDTKRPWFDGHLDLAYLTLEGRDMTALPPHAQGGPQPAGVTLESLRQAETTHVMGTIFTAPDFNTKFGYPRHDDVEGAHKCGVQQLKVYKTWEQIGLAQIVRGPEDLLTPSWQTRPPLRLVMLMEGADPIRSPEEVAWWFDQGLRVVGLAWATGTRYAGGNHTHGPLTKQGQACVRAIDECGMIHDLSHLSDEAAQQLLQLSQGPVIASHSNARTLLGGKSQRHISDTLIRAIGKRGGVLGVNLLSRFLHKAKGRASIDDVVAHIEYLCEQLQNRTQIGLGSDIDGGFPATELPHQLDSHLRLPALWEALQRRGWSDQECQDFASGNWLRFLQQHLPTQQARGDSTNTAPVSVR